MIGQNGKKSVGWMKRRAAIESGIGHLKREHRIDRNRFKGNLGGRINAMLGAAGISVYCLFEMLVKRNRFLFENQITNRFVPLNN